MRRDIFQAIADPTRRAIIALIAVQAMTPNALAENFHTSRQAISKHLRILTECELVKQEQQGREIYYQLELKKMKEIDKWLEQYRKIWETRFNQLDKVLLTMKKIKLPPAKQVDLWLKPKAKFQDRSRIPVGYSLLCVPLLPDISHTFLSCLHLFQPCSQNILLPKNDSPNKAASSTSDNS